MAVITYEKEQFNKLIESSIYKTLKENTQGKQIECVVHIGNVSPEYAKIAKIQKGRVLSIVLYKEGKMLEDEEGGVYQAFTIISQITKKGKICLFEWGDDNDFISDINGLILWLQNQ